MVTARKKTEATLADLEDLPPGVKGEIIEGTLYTHPRPRPPHQRAIFVVGNWLGDPFDFRGGPGGWWIVPEPGIELPNAAELSPDVAGWRRERLPEYPEDKFKIVPDWVCEVLSPSNRQYDQSVKRPLYAKLGVPFLWFVDTDARTLMVHRLVDGKWLELGVWAEDALVRAPPFQEIELPLGELWRRLPKIA